MRVDEMRIDPFSASIMSNFPKTRENAMFDAFAEHAAAQKKSVQVQSRPRGLVDDNPNETVIAKAITNGNGQALRLLFLMDRHDVRFAAALLREVQLIDSPGE